jgi:5-formyltetrahydrofolate cyclo-ligase
VPVIVAKGAALAFRAWRPGCALARGPFGVSIPEDPAELRPVVVIAPLLAFDRRGFRLGYGGGYFDRTLAALRAQGPVRAIGLAWSGQELPEVPAAPHDAPLDLVVTPDETIVPGRTPG